MVSQWQDACPNVQYYFHTAYDRGPIQTYNNVRVYRISTLMGASRPDRAALDLTPSSVICEGVWLLPSHVDVRFN